MRFIIFIFINFSLIWANPKDIQLPFPSDLEEELNLPAQEKEKEPNSSDLNPEGTKTGVEAESEEIKNDGLPNLKPKKKGKTGDSDQDLKRGAYPRGNYHLNRLDTNRAIGDYNTSVSGEGLVSFKSKLEMIRLLAKERKTQQAKSMIDGIENPPQKFEAMFELAMGLQNSAKTKEEKEESLALYLFISTEAPVGQEKPNPLLPRTSWAIGVLLFQLEDYIPALDHLSKIITDYKDSDYYDDALYLSGRIYEEGKNPHIKNTERAKKYYRMFLEQKDKEKFKDSIYLNEVKRRYARIK